MEQKRYWQSFGELNKTNAYQSAAKDEFQEDLPSVEDDKGLLDAKTPRRDFLKYLGFSTAAAAVAASCEQPVRKAIPFVNKPEDVVPGVANFYATTFVQDGEVVPALAKVRDGRPIKIEGNELSPVTLGGTSARMQASVLDLYDTSRLRYPLANGKEVSTFDAFDKMVAADLSALGGRPVVLLTSSVTSPTTRAVIGQFLGKFPGSRHVMYDAISYTGMLLANQATYGTPKIPSYNLAAAKVIVGINADFLSSWINPVEFNKQYSYGRKLNRKKPDMSRHIQFESLMSMTGANADERYHHRPSETGAIAVALYAALGGAATPPALDPRLQQAVQKTAAMLTKNRGAAVVLAGSNDTNIQIVVNGINELIGANGTTIDWSSTYNTRQGIDANMSALVNDLNAGAVGALLIHDANPVYNYFDSKRFADGLKKVGFAVSFSPKLDETAELCKYVIPDHNYLESWGDAEVKTGFVSLIQPTINPLFKTRHWQDSLLKWSGAPADYPTFFRQYWVGRLGGDGRLDKALQDGVLNGGTSTNTILTTRTSSAPDTARSIGVPGLQDLAKPSGAKSAGFIGTPVGAAITAIGSARKGGNAELVLYQKVTLGSGQQANNPWLHEAPDPITKATWDNYAVISPAMAKSLLKIDLEDRGQTDDYEVHPEKPVIKISVNGKSIELPVIIVPGTNPNTIGVALGYGRGTDAATKDDDADTRRDLINKARTNIGRAGGAVGKNVYPFVTFNGLTRDYFIPVVDVSDAGYNYKIAQSQTHLTYEGRTEVVLETTLATFRKEPEMFSERREELHEDFAPKEGQNFERDATLYPLFPKPGVKWGMSIDMNSCTGCQACVVACHVENNVPVVGKDEVARFHDMFWLRIDRYFSGELDNPSVVFQPMLCQHCDNAPCENVCPVAATMHSSEGINMMVYNRCIGTRYCANNCPYKVRRFNWADYMGADSFPDNQKGIISDVTEMMNDDLSRMVLNPDVVVRSRGVMEKCTFCVQRCQDGKLKAKKESRPLKTGENGEYDVKTACQQACPTNAIVFGNINDKNSDVYKHRTENQDRLFYSLEMLHSLPNVSYLAKVRNSDAIVHLDEEEKQETVGGQQSKREEAREGVR